MNVEVDLIDDPHAEFRFDHTIAGYAFVFAGAGGQVCVDVKDDVLQQVADELIAMGWVRRAPRPRAGRAPRLLHGRCPGNGRRDVCVHPCRQQCAVSGAALGPTDGWPQWRQGGEA